MTISRNPFDELLQSARHCWFEGTILQSKKNWFVHYCLYPAPILQHYASAKELQWAEDSSNASDKYARNYLRHQLVPVLQTIYPQVLDNLGDNIERFRDIEKLQQTGHRYAYKEITGNKRKRSAYPSVETG